MQHAFERDIGDEMAVTRHETAIFANPRLVETKRKVAGSAFISPP